MNEKNVRITFDIPIKDHTQLKAICGDKKTSLKSFIHGLILEEIKKNINPLYTEKR